MSNVLLYVFVAAVGEIVVYVDGMQGLIKCNELIQWLYQLASSKVGMLAVWVHICVERVGKLYEVCCGLS